MKCRKDRTDEILEYLNNIEPDHIRFTKEEEVDGRIAVLDLDLSVNRRTKKIEFGVHYKKTHTNITIKKRSNHKKVSRGQSSKDKQTELGRFVTNKTCK